MIIDALAAEPHFMDHIAPVWHALDPHERGTVYTRNRETAARAEAAGIEPSLRNTIPSSSSAVRLVASWGDFCRIRHQDRPVVFMEHGVGLTFGTRHGSYAGGDGKQRVSLFLCPNEQSAAANRATYPDIPVEVVGCPKLDAVEVRGVRGRTVCVSFHWPGQVVPETNWAFPEYRNHLRNLADNTGCEVIGHGHPRVWPRLKSLYDRLGVEPVEHFGEVLERADLYVHDAGSTIYEFAAAGRPVVVLNSRFYRREVEHGLRFWSHVPGPQVDSGPKLAPTIRDMIDGGWRKWETARLEALRAAYGPDGPDGHAAKRAVEAIRRHLGRR